MGAWRSGMRRSIVWFQQAQFWGFRFMEMDKTQMQWLLAGIGAVIVALIYLWGIRARIKEEIRKRRRHPSPENEPVLSEGNTPLPESDLSSRTHTFGDLGVITPDHHLADKALVDVEILPVNRRTEPPLAVADIETAPTPAETSRETRREPRSAPQPKMTVALAVIAPRGQSFNGQQIRTAAEDLQFRLNANGLFERFPEDETVLEPVFSMAHLREPGLFDPQALDTLATPGLLLFMKLPGPLEEMRALELLLTMSDQLAKKLGGVICDERRNPLTNQALMHLRSEVAELERRRRVWAQLP